MRRDRFSRDRLAVWTAWLVEEWERAAEDLQSWGVELRRPNFHVHAGAASRYGQWNPGRRLVEVAERVFTDFPRSALVEVLRHEVAHQVVSEYFQRDGEEPPHGPTWRKVCGWLGCDDRVTSCDEVLREARSDADGDSALREKVRKILRHGQDAGATAAESETFLAKARQLMLRHNLALADVEIGTDPLADVVWVQRPVGRLFKRLPGYYHTLGNLLGDHYFVNYIQTHTRVFVGGIIESRTRIELFGQRVNVDAAEFVCHELLRQAEILWQAHKRTHSGRSNRRSFFIGLFQGFASALAAEQPEISDAGRALMLREATERHHAWRVAYGSVRRTRMTYNAGASHAAGVASGKSLRIVPRSRQLPG